VRRPGSAGDTRACSVNAASPANGANTANGAHTADTDVPTAAEPGTVGDAGDSQHANPNCGGHPGRSEHD